MKRIKSTPRKDYVKKIEALGFNFHPEYWKEDAYYELTKEEQRAIEDATVECYDMYIAAVQHVIDEGLWDSLKVPAPMVPHLVESWNRNDLSLYGRFDFAMVKGVPKLLEFNSDTPTSLLEASIIQWGWKEEVLKDKDQFNSIHEELVAAIEYCAKYYGFKKLSLTGSMDNLEDFSTLAYLSSCCSEAGVSTETFNISDLWCNRDLRTFSNPAGEQIEALFKLYPYEWMFNEEGSPNLHNLETIMYEPLWKAIMSNKYLLVVLAELFPNSPYILKAGSEPLKGDYCKKPIFSREGANVTLVKDGKVIEESDGDYGEEGFVYQELVDLGDYDGKFPVIGSWVIGGMAAGMGIRENTSKITDNMSNFVPHVF